MALTQERILISAAIKPQQHCEIEVRENTVVSDSGVEIARNNHRYIIAPGRLDGNTYVRTDLTQQYQEVRITAQNWTDQVHTNYEQFLRNNQ